MNFVVVTNEWLSEHGIIPLPTMRKSKDGSKIIMHEDYLKPYMREEESEVNAENPNGWLPSERYQHNSSKLNELLQSEEWTWKEEEAPMLFNRNLTTEEIEWVKTNLIETEQ